MVKRVEITYENGVTKTITYSYRWGERDGIVRFDTPGNKQIEVNMNKVLQIREL